MLFSRKETPLLEAYGKLPLARDYLRAGCSEGNGILLREFFDRGFSTAMEGGKPPMLPYALRFVMSERDGAPVIGSAWQSSDTGGLRPFPFLAFCARKKKALVEDWAGGLVQSASLWRELERVWGGREEHADGQGFLAAVRGRALDLEALEPVDPPQVELAAWLRGLFGAEGERGLAGLFDRLRAHARSGARTPLRVPIVGELASLPQMQAWTLVLGEFGLTGGTDLPTVFFPQLRSLGGERRWATFFAAVPAPRDVPWLVEERALGPGDLCADWQPHDANPDPTSEGTAALTDSVRGLFTSWKAAAGAR